MRKSARKASEEASSSVAEEQPENQAAEAPKASEEASSSAGEEQPEDQAEEDKTPLSYRTLPSGDALIDLHGLPVEVAKIAVQVAIEDLITGPGPGGGGPQGELGDLIIVTGVGKHSVGGVALVRPAVIEFLRDQLRLTVLETRRDGPGRLRVPAEELRHLRGVPKPT